MSRLMRVWHGGKSLARAVLSIAWLYAWIVPMVIALRLANPPTAVAILLLTIGAFFGRHVLRPLHHPRLAARFRLRPVRSYLPLLTLAAAAQFVLALSSVVLHEEAAARRLVPPLPDGEDLALASFMAHPLGAVALILALVVLVPLVEEFGFRGRMQYELEQTLGAVPAILTTAAAFSALHGVINAVHHVPFAIFVGWLVWRTGSIWGAVYMHAVNNAVVAASLYLPERWVPGTIPPGLSPYAIGAAIVTVSALIAIAARINAVANQTGRRSPSWIGARSAIPRG
jgi:membrane protease YdiL (CAAX protease family)